MVLILCSRVIFVCFFCLPLYLCAPTPDAENRNLNQGEETDQRASLNDTIEILNGQLNNHISQSGFETSNVEESSTLDSDPNTRVLSETIVHPNIRNVDNSDFDQEDLCGDDQDCRQKLRKSKLKRETAILDHLLTSLQLSAPPVIREEDKVPMNSPAFKNAIRDAPKEILNEFDVQSEAETKSKRLISVAKKSRFAGNDAHDWLYFNLTSENHENREIRAATLFFYVVPQNYSASEIVVHLEVFVPREEGGYRPRFHKRITVSVDEVRRNEGWMTLDYAAFTQLVSGWVVQPENNFGIRLRSVNVDDAVANGHGENQSSFKPYLNIEYGSVRRQKRSSNFINYCNRNSRRTDCCIYKLTIDFHAIGWNFIIYPRNYTANFCSGHCSAIQHHESVARTLIRSQAAQNHMTESIETCCVPKEYDSLNLLYYDRQSNLIYSEVPDLKIRRCGCS